MPDDLFARADTALCAAKRQGRNRVVISDGATQLPDDALVANRHL